MTKKIMGRAVGLMTPHFRAIRYGCTIAQALEAFRDAQGEVKGSYVFILNAQDSLMGYISLSNLMRYSPGEVISESMVKKVVAVHETDTQEKTARLIVKYKLEEIAVVDERGRILGIVTARDALDYLLPKA